MEELPTLVVLVCCAGVMGCPGVVMTGSPCILTLLRGATMLKVTYRRPRVLYTFPPGRQWSRP